MLDFFLDLLFLVPVSGDNRSIGGGLSLDAHKKITNSYKLSQSSGSLYKVKKSVVRFLYHSGVFEDNWILPHLLVASQDANDDVSKISDTYVKKLTNINPEEKDLINRLMMIFLGTEDNKKLKKSQQRQPANAQVKLKLVTWLCRSVKAANMFPLSLKVLFNCLFAKDSYDRLKICGMEYFNWILLKAEDKQIQSPIALILKKGIFKLISDAPNPRNSASLQKLRGMTYTALGHLATRKPALKYFIEDIQIASLFFERLTQEIESLRPSIQEGLSSLCNAYKHMNPNLRYEMRMFLLTYLENSEDKRVRVSALLWLNKLFPFSDAQVRFYFLIYSDDDNVQVRNEARRGFAPRMFHDDIVSPSESKSKEEMDVDDEMPPLVEDDTKMAMDEVQQTSTSSSFSQSSSSQSVSSDLGTLKKTRLAPYPNFSEFVTFVENEILDSEKVKNFPLRERISPYVYDQILLFAHRCLNFHNNSNLHVHQNDNSMSVETTVEGLRVFQKLLHKGFDQYKITLARAGMVHETASLILSEIVSRNNAELESDYSSEEKIQWIKKHLFSSSYESQKYMSVLLRKVSHLYTPDTCLKLLQELSQLILDTQKSSVQELNQAKEANGAIFGAAAIIESLAISERVPHTSDGLAEDSLENKLLRVIHECARKMSSELKSSIPEIRSTCCQSLGNIGKHMKLPLERLSTSKTPQGMEIDEKKTLSETDTGEKMDTETDLTISTTISDMFDVAKDCKKNRTVSEHAINALGDVALGDRSNQVLDQIREGLFGLKRIREEELHFAIGMSFSKVGNGEFVENNKTSASEKQPPKKRSKTETDGDISRQQMEKVIGEILLEHLAKGSANVRAGACIWLMSLVNYGGKHPVIQEKILDIQLAFSRLLADSRKFTQECASKGLALAYECVGTDMQEELINNLIKTLGAGKRVVSDNTEVRHVEGVSTYKELCGIASDLGSPDLVYKFMDLAAHSAIWSSKAGAAFSLTNLGSLKKVTDKLKPQLDRMIPKLYRYQYDPDEDIRRTMTTLWKALVDDPVAAVEKHFVGIMREMISCLDNRQWRVRQACTVAIADIIVGRSYDQMQFHMEELWQRMFHVLDDVKDSVRRIAFGLARNVMNLSKRLCDPRLSKDEEVKGTVQMLLPYLLEKGITARAKEVQAVSIQTVVAIAKAAGVHLRPYLSSLIFSLLQAMSTLEDSAFSYLQFHTAALETTTEQLEELRIAISKASPLSDALGHCMRLVDDSTAEGVCGALAEVVSDGVGLPTLSAAAQFVVRLIGSDCRDHVKPYCKRLLRAFSYGLQDQSSSIRKEYATALSYVCSISKPKQVHKVLNDMKSLYLLDRTNNVRNRSTAAMTVKEIASHAGDVFKENTDDILAVAFIGMHDTDQDTAKAWKSIWNEVAPGKLSGVRQCLNGILEIFEQLFGSSEYTLKKVSLASIMDVAKILQHELVDQLPRVMALLLDGLSGRIWTGKEKLLETYAVIAEQCKRGLEKEYVVDTMLLPLLGECQKKNQDYRRQAIESFGRICVLYPEIDMFQQTRSVLGEIVEDDLVEEESKEVRMDDKTMNEKQQTRKKNDSFRAKCYFCLGQAFPSALHYETQISNSEWLLKCFLVGLARNEWTVRVAILRSLKRFVSLIFLEDKSEQESKKSVLSSHQCHELVNALLLQSKDEKYSAVRHSAMEALHELLSRKNVASIILNDIDVILSRMDTILKDDKNPHVIRLTHMSKAAAKEIKKSGVSS